MHQTSFFSVPPQEAGDRLDCFLAKATSLSRAQIQRLMGQGHVRKMGHPIERLSQKVKEADVYEVFVPPAQSLSLIPEDMDLEIVFEDPFILVVNKRAHQVVHPSPGHATGTLVHGLLAHCGDALSGIGGVKRPGIVHRLDKGTSGLMVVAKTDAAHQGLSAQFASRQLFRMYEAFVWKTPSPLQGKISLSLGRHPVFRQKQAVVHSGRQAITHYKVLQSFGNDAISHVTCRLETGRTHQIRVHMQALKHPLIGDPLYGGTHRFGNLPQDVVAVLKAWESQRPALHAGLLSFKHPIDTTTLEFHAPLPEDMARLLTTLQNTCTPSH